MRYLLLLQVLLAGPLFMVWAVAADRLERYLKQTHPGFIEERMRSAREAYGYKRLLRLSKVLQPDPRSAELAKRARLWRHVANGWLIGGLLTALALGFLVDRNAKGCEGDQTLDEVSGARAGTECLSERDTAVGMSRSVRGAQVEPVQTLARLTRG